MKGRLGTVIVWALWDCESLVGVYGRREDAEVDRAALHAQARAAWDRPPVPDPSAPLGLEVCPMEVATSPRHAAGGGVDGQPGVETVEGLSSIAEGTGPLVDDQTGRRPSPFIAEALRRLRIHGHRPETPPPASSGPGCI
jgi:hypothetical protein